MCGTNSANALQLSPTSPERSRLGDFGLGFKSLELVALGLGCRAYGFGFGAYGVAAMLRRGNDHRST